MPVLPPHLGQRRATPQHLTKQTPKGHKSSILNHVLKTNGGALRRAC